MKKRTSILGAGIAYLAMTLAAFAQPEPPTCAGSDLLAQLRTDRPDAYRVFEEETAGIPNAEGLLWRIEKPGVKPSHLFGTIHLTDPRVTNFAPEVRKAFGESSTLALELAGTGDLKASIEVSRLAFAMGRKMSPEPALTNLSDEEREKVVISLKARGLPGKTMQAVKPWFLAMSLALPACELVRQGAAIEMVDAKIANMARRRKMPIVGLETEREQLEALASMEPWVYEAMIRDSSRSEARNQDMMELLVRLHIDRSVGGMVPAYRQVIQPGENMDAFRAFVSALLDKRNAIMAERSLPLLEKGGVFIAVGAMHLPDEDGLVQRFRRYGYEVTRVW